MSSTKFWFVWCPAGRAPTYKHPSQLSAKTEAERLATMNPGSEFIVLESVGSVYFEQPLKWQQHDYPPPPF